MKKTILVVIIFLLFASLSSAGGQSKNDTDDWLKDFTILTKADGDIDKGYYDRAIAAAQMIILKKTSKPDILVHAHITLGVAYKNKGMFDEAIVALQKVPEVPGLYKDSSFIPMSHLYLGKTYSEMKSYQKAISEFSKAIEIEKKSKKEFLKKNRADYDRSAGVGSYQSQMDQLDDSIAESLINLAMAHIDLSDLSTGEHKSPQDVIPIPKESIEAINEVLKIKPNSPHILEAVSYFISKDNSQDIISWCDKLIRINPNISKVYYVRGRTYMTSENFQQSIKDFSKAIELDSQNFEAYKFRGMVFSIIGNNEMATKDYDSAITMNPSDADLYYFRGRANLYKIEVTKDGITGVLDKDKEQAEQAFKDIGIAARLGNKDAQDFLRNPQKER